MPTSSAGGHSPIDRFTVAFAERVLRRRFLVIAICLVGAILLAVCARSLTFGNNYRVFFSDENPELVAFETLQNTYAKSDSLFFMVRHRDGGDAFRKDVMEAVAELTEAAWQIPFATRVDSVTNFQHSSADGYDLVIEDLIEDPSALSPAEFAEKRDIAVAEPLIYRQLVSADTKATAVNVVVQYPQIEQDEIARSAAAARALRDEIMAAHPDVEVVLSGVAMLNHAFTESAERDFSTLVPAMFVLVLLLTLITIRSIAATLAVMLIIVLSIAMAFGFAGALGFPLTPIAMSSMIVILTLAVADSIHILLTLRGNLRHGMDQRSALVDAMRVNFLAVGITSLTTVVGFLALNFSDAPPFKHLGNMAAMGIAAAWLFSITLLPALVSLVTLRIPPKKETSDRPSAMTRLGGYIVRHNGRFALGFALFGAVLIAQIPRIDLNDQWTEYFGKSLEFRTATDKVTEEFGLYTVEFSVPAGEPDGVSDPAYLQRLEGFTQWLRTHEHVRHVYSFTDIMKRLNRNMNGDDPAYDVLPDNRELAAQYLLLYELSLPYGLDLNDRIDIARSATRLTVTLDEISTTETKALLAEANDYIVANFPEGQRATPTSTQVMFTFIAERNINQMVEGTIVAIVVISLIMIFALRNLRLGLLSLIPNALPIAGAFGIWALIRGEVGFSIAIVAAISLGIVVDDTVHMMTKYLRARREKGLGPHEAIIYAFENVGLAIFVNTVILAIGFSLLMLSAFKVTQDMGLLTCLSIVLALMFDFFLLPALLIWVDRLPSTSPKGDDHAASLSHA